MIPQKGNCFSIDLRVANILHAKWICEALFLALTSRSSRVDLGMGSDTVLPPSVSAADLRHTCRSLPPAAHEWALAAQRGMLDAVSSCRMPLPLPFERQYSDGMEQGATLEFIYANLFAEIPRQQHDLPCPNDRVVVNPIVAVTVKKRDESNMVLHLRAVSALTTCEYMRFSIICPAHCYDALKGLEEEGEGQWKDLESWWAKGSKRSRVDLDIGKIFRILVYANVLTIGSLGQGGTGSSKTGSELSGAGSSKRRKL